MDADKIKKENLVTPPKIQTERTEVLRPDDSGSAEIYSRLGYKLSEAIADLVDNSIDAHAKNILIRFIRTDDHIRRVLIIDDGHGLSDAVIFGTDIKDADMQQALKKIVKSGRKNLGETLRETRNR